MKKKPKPTEKEKKTILIADDEPTLLQFLRLALHKSYDLYLAENGREAIEILEKVTPDLIILDIMMPEIDGFTVCEMLKKDKNKKSIPLILLSAKSMEKDIFKGLKLGADLYITKPFDPEYLEKKIAEILSKKK